MRIQRNNLLRLNQREFGSQGKNGTVITFAVSVSTGSAEYASGSQGTRMIRYL
ncbi:hypothetical protein [Paenibacillus borealis]|uniref:hypothetical protein n=1 Tax=Paenibacillus borealis TaxID=160799 RepID=UPI000AFFAAB9|nr:hypothetical protein [Paenibacillus borealis]